MTTHVDAPARTPRLPPTRFEVTVCLALTSACVDDFKALCASRDLEDCALSLRASQYVLAAAEAPPPEVAFDPIARALAMLGAALRRAGRELHARWLAALAETLAGNLRSAAR